MSNANGDWRGKDWRRWQAGLTDSGQVRPYPTEHFARCGCGTIEHLLAGEAGERFWCCECREMRVRNLIAARKMQAA